MNTTEFQNRAAILVARIASTDFVTRQRAADDAVEFLATVPKDIFNNPHNHAEITALTTLIESV